MPGLLCAWHTFTTSTRHVLPSIPHLPTAHAGCPQASACDICLAWSTPRCPPRASCLLTLAGSGTQRACSPRQLSVLQGLSCCPPCPSRVHAPSGQGPDPRAQNTDTQSTAPEGLKIHHASKTLEARPGLAGGSRHGAQGGGRDSTARGVGSAGPAAVLTFAADQAL